MIHNLLLGLSLEEAIRRLHAMGVEPAVVISCAPRRFESVGVFRVVRVKNGGREITACAFLDRVREEMP